MSFKVRKGVQQLPFEETLGASFLELFVELVELGALISVGASRDKGAVSITVTVGGEWDREWFRTEEEVLDWLKEAIVVVRQLDQTPSPASRRTRGPQKAS